MKFFSLQMLGASRIQINGRTVNLRRKPKQLVKLLALQPQQRLHREQIVEILWAGNQLEAGINNLHKTIHAARRALEPDLVSGNDSQYILTKEGQVILTAPNELQIDVLEFEKLAAALKNGGDEKTYETALEIYTGDLLPEDLYEDWAAERRESLRLTHRRLLQKLAKMYETDGRVEQSATIYQKLLALDELDEPTHRSLIKAYALGGNRQSAIRQYEICHTALKRELNVEPEYDTRHLFEQITSGKFQAQTESAGFSFESNGAKSTPTQPKPKTNLPHRLTSFIGREREIGEIKNLLESARLLTLTGTGGIGKTRLAHRVGEESIEKYADGVWLVELAAINDSSLVAGAIAAALGVSEESNRSITVTLSEFLRDRETLLVLDNCEHLVAACAALAAGLLENCPRLNVLTTTREALDVEGEIVWRVSALSLPKDVDLLPNAENLVEYEAVRLFVERARLNNPRFALTASNSSAIARICRKLGGIPLALELAAARARVISVEQIAARLGDSLQLLTGGGRNVTPRHQTLRGTVDWSYALLPEIERAAWRGLSVFAGGFTLGAAEAACAELTGKNNSVLDLLTDLADKSIIAVETRGIEARYSMLETLRQFGAEKLREAKEEARFREIHYEYFRQLAERAEGEFSGSEQRLWFARLENDNDNLRSALEWSSTENAAKFLTLANALWHFWQSSGRLEEGRRWFEAAIEASGDAPAGMRVKALHRLGGLMVLQCDYTGAEKIYESGLGLSRASGDKFYTARILANLGFALVNKTELERAEAILTEALQIFRELQDANGIARTLNGLGTLIFYRGDFERASKIFEDALVIFRRVDKKINVLGMLQNLGASAHLQAKLTEAEKYLREAMQIAEELGERRWINQTRHVLGYVCNDRRDYRQATKLFTEALTLDTEVGGKHNVAHVFEGLACAAAAQKNYARALKLIACADALRTEVKAPRVEALQNYYNKYLNAARRTLEPVEIDCITRQIDELPYRQMLEFALSDV